MADYASLIRPTMQARRGLPPLLRTARRIASMTRLIQRFCDGVDALAGLLLGLCTLLVVVTAIGRYTHQFTIPDAFDISRYLIGACVAWGFASLGYRGGHIAVDLLY